MINNYDPLGLGLISSNALELEKARLKQEQSSLEKSRQKALQEKISMNEKITLPTMKQCQEFWGTTQTMITIPTKVVNATKNAPIGSYIGFSIMSGKQGGNTIDGTGKGARIMNEKRISRLYKNVTELREIKPSTLERHLRKLRKLKTKEFEYVTLLNSNGKENQYYRLDYSDGFVWVDLRIIHYMMTCYSDKLIQCYLIFLWNCRSGWAQVTRQQMATHMGLTISAEGQAKIYMTKLVQDGFIEQREQYQEIRVVDKIKNDGSTKSITMPYYEYRVVNIDEIDSQENEEEVIY